MYFVDTAELTDLFTPMTLLKEKWDGANAPYAVIS